MTEPSFLGFVFQTAAYRFRLITFSFCYKWTCSVPLLSFRSSSCICNCLSTEIIRYSIVLEILLEMCFCAAVGVPKKSGVARLFKVFATAVLANFQDCLVMIAVVCRRIPRYPSAYNDSNLLLSKNTSKYFICKRQTAITLKQCHFNTYGVICQVFS